MKIYSKSLILKIAAALTVLILSTGCARAFPDKASAGQQTPLVTENLRDIKVEVVPMQSITAAFYLQLPDLNITFIDFIITNDGSGDVKLSVESEIQGYSEKAVNMVDVHSHETITVGQTPALKIEAIPSEIKTATVHYRIANSSGTVVDEQTFPIKIYAKDTMIWATLEGDNWTDTTPFIAAFVTPHVEAVNDLIRKAADYESQRSMQGYQCGECSEEKWEEYTQGQVQAIYESLQNDYKITYINSSIAYSNNSDAPQRVRLPAESLRAGSANCIDGAVLYASALENLGIHAYIVITPTHAFVGYETMPDQESSVRFLETTMTGSASFEDAVEAGNQEYQDEINNGDFKAGKTQLLKIEALREEGIHPMQ